VQPLARSPFELDTPSPVAAPVQSLSTPPWESVFVVVAIVMFTTNFTEIFLSFGGTGTSYPPQVRLAFLAIYGISGLLLLRSRQALPTLLATAPLLVAVLAVPPLSILWSIDPGESLERVVAVLGTSAFGAYLGWRFTLGRMVFLLAVAMAAALGLSVIAIVAMPSVGIEQYGSWAGTWIGIHFHKNGLGSAAALGTIVIGYAISDSRGAWRLAFGAALAVALVLLVGSQSTTSLVAVLVVGTLALWTRLLQTLPRQIPVLSVIVGFAVLVTAVQIIDMDFIESALATLGKRSDLTSRVPLWGIVWTFIEQRFWLGYGFEAFWQADSPAIREIEERLYFVPFYSHSGLLETWLNGGLVLVTLVLAMLAFTIAKAAVLVARWRSLTVSAFPLSFCCYFIMMNLSEGSVLSRNSITWTLLVGVSVFVGKWVRLRVL
jgi:exopolysaccharide production protein ExoQ